MNYLRIKSVGVIETLAFSLIGASTKREDTSKIGYFGSGLKYAIASMLRNGINFRVFSGMDEIKFGTIATDFREQKFQVITVNGKETSLTTDMGGKDWDTGFAPIREVYSNALDEDQNATVSKVTRMTPAEGFTTIYIEMNAVVEDFFQNIGSYFCKLGKQKALAQTEYGDIYPRQFVGLRLFRKGILCKDEPKQVSLFAYDSPLFKINESRVLADEWMAEYYTAMAWGKVENTTLVSQLLYTLNGNNLCWEYKLNWEYPDYSESWKKACKDKKLYPIEHRDIYSEEEKSGAIALPFTMLKRLKERFPEVFIIGMDNSSSTPYSTSVEAPSEEIVSKVDEAVAILQSTSYGSRMKSPQIEFVKFANQYTLACADPKNGKMYLSTKLDAKSAPEIAKIIIEENEHNLSGFSDKTREFQDHMFDLYYEQLTLNNKLKEKIKELQTTIKTMEVAV